MTLTQIRFILTRVICIYVTHVPVSTCPRLLNKIYLFISSHDVRRGEGEYCTPFQVLQCM